MKISPVYTMPFSFHIGLVSCHFQSVFIKGYEAYRIGAFSCKQGANLIWNEKPYRVNRRPIRYETNPI